MHRGRTLAKLLDPRFVERRKRLFAAVCDSRLNETWLPAVGYEGRYEVSSLGRVRSLSRTEKTAAGHSRPVVGRLLQTPLNYQGYPQVCLRINGKARVIKVHRLVCEAFHAAKRSALHREVAHLDGDRANCRADNLKWVSHVENHFHRREHGTHPAGEKHPRAKLTEANVIAIRHASVSYGTLAEHYGVSPHTISDIKRGRRWQSVTEGLDAKHESGGARSAIAQTPSERNSHDPS